MNQLICNVNYKIPSDISVSDEAKDLIKRILVADPSKRITLSKIDQHPFLNDPCIPRVFGKELLMSKKRYEQYIHE